LRHTRFNDDVSVDAFALFFFRKRVATERGV